MSGIPDGTGSVQAIYYCAAGWHALRLALLCVQGTRIMSILAMMMSLLVALVCTYIASMMPCTAPHFDQRTCDLFHIMLFGVAAWFACMSGLAGAIAYQTTQIKLLLEPKTQGVLTLH